MNIDLVLLLVFALILLVLIILKRKKLQLEKIAFPVVYMVLYRTKIGIKLMDKVAKKYPRFLNYFAMFGVYIAFFGMVFIFYVLFKGVYAFMFMGAQPPVAPLFPGVKVPGLPVMSFLHWIIAIFILATVHEFNHGLVSRLYNIKIKSSGVAIFSFLLPIIPAAFVEPDEKQLKKAKNKSQLGVLAAGSYANFITGGIFLLIFVFLLVPFTSGMVDENALVVEEIEEGYAADLGGIKINDEIILVNNIKVSDIDKLTENLNELKPGDKVSVKTKSQTYDLIAGESPENKSKGYIGISFKNKIDEKVKEKYGKGLIGFIFWLRLLVFWVFVANIGVGMFNLLPMGPLDGGRMFYVIALALLKNEKKARKLWITVSWFCLLLLLISLSPFIIKLLKFIFSPLLAFIL